LPDPRRLLLLGLLDAEQHLRADGIPRVEAGHRGATRQAALLEQLLAGEEILDARLADRALAGVLPRVAEVVLVGERGGAVEIRAGRRRLVQRPAELDGMRGVQDGEVLGELRRLPALEALGELGRRAGGKPGALRLLPLRSRLEVAAAR